MTQQEGNDLIAVFMDKRDVLGILDTEPFVTNVYFSADQIKGRREQGIRVELYYHSSWDWLMPVVDKIESDASQETGHISVVIQDTHCTIYQYDFKVRAKHYGGESKINSVWQAVILFIQWYNTTKK